MCLWIGWSCCREAINQQDGNNRIILITKSRLVAPIVNRKYMLANSCISCPYPCANSVVQAIS
uniref:Uncharacterized protein n=1 Tax=Arundo donax TaxID=35708 RepID=A0A0A9HT16_ARUDO